MQMVNLQAHKNNAEATRPLRTAPKNPRKKLPRKKLPTITPRTETKKKAQLTPGIESKTRRWVQVAREMAKGFRQKGLAPSAK